MATGEPFSRHRGGGAGPEPDEWDAWKAYDHLSAERGWSVRYIRRELTSAQFLYHLDAASERLANRAQAEHEAAVEAVRIGYITARDAKAYGSWRRAMDRKSKRQVGLTGAALERAVMGLAATNPEYVIVEGA